MAERDIACRSNAEQSHAGAARVRFADTGMQVLQGVTHVGKTMLTPLDGVVAIFPSQLRERVEDIVHLLVSDVVKPVRICRGRRESNRIETQFLRQMPVDSFHIADLGSEGKDRKSTRLN